MIDDIIELAKQFEDHEHTGQDSRLIDAKNLKGILPISRGGFGKVMVDPNADRLLFWDDSAGEFAFLTLGAGLSISGTTITAAGQYEAGVVSDLSTTTTGNSDEVINFATGTFTPTFIKLYYFIQGYNASGAGGYVGRKGIAVYKGTTLALDFPLWIADDQVERLSGDDGNIGGSGSLSNVITTFVNIPNSATAPTIGGPVGGGDSTIVTFSILTTFGGGFTIRRTTTVGTPSAGPFTGRYKFAYEAYA